MDVGLSWLLVLLFAVLGVGAGLATGLLPGIHVNNVALAVLAAEPVIAAGLVGLVGPGQEAVALASFLAAAAVAHSMAALLPSVFLGAPDADTALSVLPGHRLLAQGRGMEAVLLGVRGAFLAALLAIPFLLPFRLLLGDPVEGYERLRALVPFLLLLLVALLLVTERRGSRPDGRKRAWAVVVLLLSGVLGAVVLRAGFLTDSWRPVSVPTASLVLFPLFTGLFGLPTLLLGANHRGRLPPQDLGPAEPLPPWRRTRGLVSGTLAGATVSWFPGLGGASATVVAQMLAGGEPREGDPEADREFLFAAGAANTATTVFTFATLFVVLRARSGVAAAVEAVADPLPVWQPAGNVPALFAAVLLALLVSAALAYGCTSRLVRPFALLAGRVRYARLVRAVAIALTVGVFLATGPLGLLVLGTAAAIGLIPPLVGIRRVHLMGALLVPLVLGWIG
ncbi:MAG: tripartite tricarboxylate transporter permease [Euryarchaeota archaeon]|nr:tripartite tricarboxylate transporter permease [Euryarchaeota archaeon]